MASSEREPARNGIQGRRTAAFARPGETMKAAKCHLPPPARRRRRCSPWSHGERPTISDHGTKALLVHQSRHLGTDLCRDTLALVKSFVSQSIVVAETGNSWNEIVTPALVVEHRA